MNEITLSCTTCALRNPPLDEISETFKSCTEGGVCVLGISGSNHLDARAYPGGWIQRGLQRRAAEDRS